MDWERQAAPGAHPRPSRNTLRRPRRALFVPVLLVLLALLLVLAAGCGRSQSAAPETNDDYQVSLSTLPGVPEQGDGTVVIDVRDKAGQMVSGATVSIEANMNHAGMVPVNAVAAPNTETGTYHAALTWTMGGAWYVDVKIELPNGEVIRRRFPVDVK